MSMAIASSLSTSATSKSTIDRINSKISFYEKTKVGLNATSTVITAVAAAAFTCLVTTYVGFLMYVAPSVTIGLIAAIIPINPKMVGIALGVMCLSCIILGVLYSTIPIFTGMIGLSVTCVGAIGVKFALIIIDKIVSSKLNYLDLLLNIEQKRKDKKRELLIKQADFELKETLNHASLEKYREERRLEMEAKRIQQQDLAILEQEINLISEAQNFKDCFVGQSTAMKRHIENYKDSSFLLKEFTTHLLEHVDSLQSVHLSDSFSTIECLNGVKQTMLKHFAPQGIITRIYSTVSSIIGVKSSASFQNNLVLDMMKIQMGIKTPLYLDLFDEYLKITKGLNFDVASQRLHEILDRLIVDEVNLPGLGQSLLDRLISVASKTESLMVASRQVSQLFHHHQSAASLLTPSAAAAAV